MVFTVWGSLALTAISVLLIPLVVLSFRLVIKWTKAEGKLDQTVKDLDELVKHKDDVHRWIIEQMQADRDATNKRLRWLEENLWNERKRR